jgi:hypothetical protein
VLRAVNAVTTALTCGAITPGEAATIAGDCETFLRTAGIAREKVAQGNLLQILIANDDVEDDDEDVGDAESLDGCDPWTAPADGGRRQFVKEPLFNLEEKFSCRFSADAGSGIAPCNSWLMARKATRGSSTARRQLANRGRG